MLNRKIKSFIIVISVVFLASAIGCKKGTFDINNTNPNSPSSVSPGLILKAALASTSSIYWGGDADFAEIYMGYWAVSGNYIPDAQLLTYNEPTSYAQDNWNSGYAIANNFNKVQTLGAAYANGANYQAIGIIMKVFLFQRIVDLYNNCPYTGALSASNLFPAYDQATNIYPSLVNQLDSAVAIIAAAPVTADNPGANDAMFGGTMSNWTKFARTLKLKILMRLTQTSTGPAYITSKLSGLTAASFIGAGMDASINIGYANAASLQNPLWAELGWGTTGTATGNRAYYRACNYAVNFYNNNADPRATYFYGVNNAGVANGRPLGSTNGAETNPVISSIGGNPSASGTVQTTGVLKSYAMGTPILTATESLFLQAEAIQRGYLSGTLATVYNSAVAESFRILNVGGSASAAATAAATYTAQANGKTNLAASSNALQTIILQKWAALNIYDPVETWCDWRRLGIPSDLPVSIYPGTTATHPPYRMLYPATEYSYNSANVNAQGTINAMTSKVFWQP